MVSSEICRDPAYRKERPVQYGKLFYQKPLAPIHPMLRYVHDFDARDIREMMAGGKTTSGGETASGVETTSGRETASGGTEGGCPGDDGCRKNRLRIAMIHPEVLKQSMYENMREALGEFSYFDIGIPLDAVRVVKSGVERGLIEQTNVMNVMLMWAAAQVIR